MARKRNHSPEQPKKRKKRAPENKKYHLTCVVDGIKFWSARPDALYHSNACRCKAWREAKRKRSQDGKADSTYDWLDALKS